MRTLCAHLKAGDLALFKRPKAYNFVDTLARNAANEVLRRELGGRAEKSREGKVRNGLM